CRVGTLGFRFCQHLIKCGRRVKDLEIEQIVFAEYPSLWRVAEHRLDPQHIVIRSHASELMKQGYFRNLTAVFTRRTTDQLRAADFLGSNVLPVIDEEHSSSRTSD